MSDTVRKPLPPALEALKPILDALPVEDSEDEMEPMGAKDLTVRMFFVLWTLRAKSSNLT